MKELETQIVAVSLLLTENELKKLRTAVIDYTYIRIVAEEPVAPFARIIALIEEALLKF